MNEVFLDTSYAVALSSKTDRHHAVAVELATELKASGVRLVTTRAVFLEIGNLLAKQGLRAGAVQILKWLEADKKVEKLDVDSDLYHRAFQLFEDRPDKEWGLVDCMSFVVMHELGIHVALTADKHFEQAGFRALVNRS